MASQNLVKRRPDPLNNANAERICTSTVEQFIGQFQLVQYLLDAQSAWDNAKSKKGRLTTPLAEASYHQVLLLGQGD